MATTIYFKGYDSQYKEFPVNIETDKRHISFKKNGTRFHESFQDSIEKAQDQKIPAYIFAIAEMVNDTFEIHDLYHLRRYLIQTYKTNNFDPIPEGIQAPESSRTIRKVHLFALPLFQSREKVDDVEIRGNLEAIYIDPVDNLESREVVNRAVGALNYLLLEELDELDDPFSQGKLAFTIIDQTRGNQKRLLSEEKSDLIDKLGGKAVWEDCSAVIFQEVIDLALMVEDKFY